MDLYYTESGQFEVKKIIRKFIYWKQHAIYCSNKEVSVFKSNIYIISMLIS